MNNSTDLNILLVEALKEKGRDYINKKNLLKLTSGFLILIFGLFGNVITIILMRRKLLSKLPMSIYLTALSISDLIVLIFDVLLTCIDLLLVKIDIQQITNCKFSYFGYAGSLSSAWIIINISLDRFLSVYYPHTTKNFLSKKSCIIRISISVVVSYIICLGYMIFINAPIKNGFHCFAVTPNEQYWLEVVWPILYTILFCLIPTCALFTFNALIIYKFTQKKKNLSKIIFQKTMRARASFQNGGDTSTELFKKLNLTTLGLCVSFLILTLPGNIFMIIKNQTLKMGDEYINEDSEDQLNALNYLSDRNYYLETLFIYSLLNSFMSCIYSINFFLYVMTSNLFRNEFLLMLGFKSPSKRRIEPLMIRVTAIDYSLN